MKTAKIQTIKGTRKWDGPNGTVYYFDVLMDNGDTGSIGKKSDSALKEGDQLTYELEESERGNKIKPVVENNFRGGGGFQKQPSNPASFALSYAKDLAVANINKSDKPLEMDSLATKVIATAEKFNNWLKENA